MVKTVRSAIGSDLGYPPGNPIPQPPVPQPPGPGLPPGPEEPRLPPPDPEPELPGFPGPADDFPANDLITLSKLRSSRPLRQGFSFAKWRLMPVKSVSFLA